MHFTAASDNKSPQKCFLQLKWYQEVRIAEEVQILCEHATILRRVFTTYLVVTEFSKSLLYIVLYFIIFEDPTKTYSHFRLCPAELGHNKE